VLEASENRLVMESESDEFMHVRLRRTLTLDPKRPVLTIRNTLTQEKPTPWPAQIWSVTQCPPPNYTLLGISDETPEPDRPYINLLHKPPLPEESVKLLDGAVRFVRPPDQGCAKIGAIGTWCASVYNDVVFLQTSDASPQACYPDGANVEVFACGDYIELETLSPSKHLRPGDALSNTVTWSLRPVDPDSSAAQVLRMIRNAH